MDLANFRKEYTLDGLTREKLNEDPFQQFELWFKQACDADLLEPNAVNLATVSQDGQPTQRTVLLKYFDHRGFVFFTNYQSRKARQIEKNNKVSLLFLWIGLQRQVHICGKAEKVSTAESLKYFATRPRGSQIGAWCSQQSSVITSRKILELQFEQIKQKFQNREIPLPDSWGGYRVIPDSFEFWQGRENRLHDRFLYTKLQEQSGWQIQRLAP